MKITSNKQQFQITIGSENWELHGNTIYECFAFASDKMKANLNFSDVVFTFVFTSNAHIVECNNIFTIFIFITHLLYIY